MRLFRAGVLGGVSLAAYMLIEPLTPRLRTKWVPLPSGYPALDVLHLSDTHMKGRDKPLQSWLRRLPDLLAREPDLVLATGDLIDDNDGIDPLLEALAGLEARSGKFYVRGSHDIFQSRYRPPTKYFKDAGEPPGARLADTARLEKGLQQQGWQPLTNASARVEMAGATVRVAGVDDPYLRRHRTDHIERGVDDDLALALVHAPEVVSEWILHGFDLVLGGHTHGGQVRLPFVGAMVTNSSLPAALASGLHAIGRGWLHMSPGLGTSKYTPIRFLCRPEATLLKLRPAPG